MGPAVPCGRAVRPTCGFAGLLPLAMAEDLVVVVNKANPLSDVTTSQLKKLVLGQQNSWTSGKKVSLVFRSPGSPERQAVLHSVCGVTAGKPGYKIKTAN